MSGFLKRSLSGLVYVVLFTIAIFFSEASYVVLTSIFALVCIWEFSRILSVTKIVSFFVLGLFAFLPFLNFGLEQYYPILLFISLTGSLQMLLYLFFNRGHYPFTALQKIDISIRYLVFSLGFLVMLPFHNSVYQEMIIFSILLFIWTNDSFAYLIGKSFGKRKLFEKVSPKKTIEGFIGGVVFTIITGLIISYYSDLFSPKNWVILSIMTSVLGTAGDLIESKFKRRAKVKDSGIIMPGHGGLLDRLDSLLFVSPFVYLYIHYII